MEREGKGTGVKGTQPEVDDDRVIGNEGDEYKFHDPDLLDIPIFYLFLSNHS
jgi:hypothetical protein